MNRQGMELANPPGRGYSQQKHCLKGKPLQTSNPKGLEGGTLKRTKNQVQVPWRDRRYSPVNRKPLGTSKETGNQGAAAVKTHLPTRTALTAATIPCRVTADFPASSWDCKNSRMSCAVAKYGSTW